MAGRSFRSNVFNGQYIPPVLKLQRGDRLELQFVNRIAKADVQIDGPQSTNLHYHGMVVPPVAPGDDVFLTSAPAPTTPTAGRCRGPLARHALVSPACARTGRTADPQRHVGHAGHRRDDRAALPGASTAWWNATWC